MSGRNVKNANTGPLDALFLSTDHADSPFVYPGYRTVTNYSTEKVVVQPRDRQGVNFGAQTTYKLDLQGDFIGKIVRKVTMSAVTPGGGATYTRFVDKAGVALSDEIEVKYGVNRLPKVRDNELEAWYLGKKLDYEEQETLDELVAGNKSAAERDALAAAQQTWYIEVPVWWASDPRAYIHQHSLAQELEIKFNNRSLLSLLDTDDNTATATFTEELHVLYYHVNNQESNAHTMRLRQETGIVYGITSMQRVPQKTVPASSTEFTVDLQNLTLPSRGLICQLRKKANVLNPGGTQPNDYYKYETIDTLSCESSAGEFVRPQDDLYNRLFLQPKYFPGRPGDKSYFLSFAFEPCDPLHASGHLSISNLNNPVFKAQWSAALDAVEYVMDVFSVAQEILQASQGDLQLIVS